MEKKENEKPCRQPYKKPELRVVELEAKEVLATGCKTSTGNSAFDFPSNCVGNSCAQDGS
jgi:hypothetical protein